MRGGVSDSTSRTQRDTKSKRESSRARSQKEEDECNRERTPPDRDRRKILDDQYDVLQSKLRGRAFELEIEDQRGNANNCGATGSADPNLESGGGVTDPASAARTKDEIKVKMKGSVRTNTKSQKEGIHGPVRH